MSVRECDERALSVAWARGRTRTGRRRRRGTFLTGLLQGHHGGLLDEVPLDEAAEVLAVHAQVGQLEGVDGHLQGQLLAVALPGHVRARQGHDGRAGVGDPPRQPLLWGEQRDAPKHVGSGEDARWC